MVVKTALIAELQNATLIVGFNLKDFDYQVLSHYTDVPLSDLLTFDLMRHVTDTVGFRVSLDNLAHATLKQKKGANGKEALHFWETGQIDRLIKYCQQDVALTRQLFMTGCKQGRIFHRSKKGRRCAIHTEYWAREVKTLLSRASQ